MVASVQETKCYGRGARLFSPPEALRLNSSIPLCTSVTPQLIVFSELKARLDGQTHGVGIKIVNIPKTGVTFRRC